MADAPVELLFFAYRTRFSEHVYVKTYDHAAEVEAMRSPSVVGVLRGFPAASLEAAESFARGEFSHGRFMETFAGIQKRKSARVEYVPGEARAEVIQ